jgi:hypothetical protein
MTGPFGATSTVIIESVVVLALVPSVKFICWEAGGLLDVFS